MKQLQEKMSFIIGQGTQENAGEEEAKDASTKRMLENAAGATSNETLHIEQGIQLENTKNKASTIVHS